MITMEKAPVFVKIEDYKDILDILALTKEKLRQAHTLLEKIAELKKTEDTALENWNKDLDDVAQFVSEIDKTLLAPEQP